MGRYLDIARTAATSSFCPGRDYEINEINELSPVETRKKILRAVLLAVPDGVPENWVQGVGDLMVTPAHPDWKKGDWRTLQEGALRFIWEWAGQAHRLGWEAPDLFGAHPTKPRARLDCAGLVLLLQGRPIVALTKDSAAIKAASSGTLTFRRHTPPPVEQHLIWAL